MNRSTPLRRPQEFQKAGLITDSEITALTAVTQEFAAAITPTMVDAIDSSAAEHDPIHRQFVPSTAERSHQPEERSDPIGDFAHQPVPGIVHRHRDRCLLQPVSVCPVYCRFCFRREQLGHAPAGLSREQLQRAFDYIRAQPALWEVILTGGDPLILKPQQLAHIITELNAIPHLGIIRIHTRVPVVDPERIDAEMLAVLAASKKPIYLVLHTNHANEITPAAQDAIHALHRHGVVLLSQTVLLAGINDNLPTLATLMKTLLTLRVKPYYLHHLDLAKGTSHFRTSIATGQRLAKALRAQFSGLCQPTYVLDIPGGYGKIPLNYQYIHKDAEQANHYRLEDYNEQYHDYHDSGYHQSD